MNKGQIRDDVMTNPLFDMFRLEVPCPHCRETDLQIISKLIANNYVACGFCREMIDVSTEEWRAFISETAETLGRIQILPPKVG